MFFYWAFNGTPTWHAEQVSTGFGKYTGASLVANDGAATIAAQGTFGYLSFFWATYGTGTWHASTVAGDNSTFSVPSITANNNSANISAAGSGGRLMFYWNANGNPAWHSETVMPKVGSGLDNWCLARNRQVVPPARFRARCPLGEQDGLASRGTPGLGDRRTGGCGP